MYKVKVREAYTWGVARIVEATLKYIDILKSS